MTNPHSFSRKAISLFCVLVSLLAGFGSKCAAATGPGAIPKTFYGQWTAQITAYRPGGDIFYTENRSITRKRQGKGGMKVISVGDKGYSGTALFLPNGRYRDNYVTYLDLGQGAQLAQYKLKGTWSMRGKTLYYSYFATAVIIATGETYSDGGQSKARVRGNTYTHSYQWDTLGSGVIVSYRVGK